jgi:hypothetical protein
MAPKSNLVMRHAWVTVDDVHAIDVTWAPQTVRGRATWAHQVLQGQVVGQPGSQCHFAVAAWRGASSSV